MANHPSAEKRNRQRVKRTLANRSTKSAVRTELKSARTLVASKPADAKAAVTAAESVLARAASKGAISKKAASRKTSRLAKALHKAVAAAK
ncbi:MAG: 30S ribosomal protein S20 [Polyangiaceae bacterium]|nr:30S ribosomal protein S20 [Polyangiaceae bacterium]